MSPWQFSGSEWWQVIKRTLQALKHDNVNVIAAGVAFFSLLAIFPLITAALSIFSYFTNPGDVDAIIRSVSALMPGDALGIITDQISSVLNADQSKVLSLIHI